MKTHIIRKQNKNSTQKHKAIRTTAKVSAWHEQLCKISGGLKPVYRALTSPKVSAMVQFYTHINKKRKAG